MHEVVVDIASEGGAMPSFVVHPEQGGPFPAVVVYQDFFGVREELRDIARKIAVLGYYVILPDLFYRTGKYDRPDFRNARGQTLSYWDLTSEQLAAAGVPFGKYTDANAMKDTAAIIAHARACTMVSPGGMGAVGYCLGGRLVVRALGTYPGDFIAGGVFHGTAVATDKPDSAHLDIPQVRGELYFGYPETDEHAPPASIALLGEALQAAGVRHQIVIHPGALHGYASTERDIFDKLAYNRDWELTFAMFHRQIPPGFLPCSGRYSSKGLDRPLTPSR